jgi:hypothetical protein
MAQPDRNPTSFVVPSLTLLERLGNVETYSTTPPVRTSELGDLGGALGAAILGSRHPDSSSWLPLGRPH